MQIYAIFTEDGLPRWFGPEPVKDSEPLNLEELRPLLAADASEGALAASWQGILITHRRVGGKWMLRAAAAPVAESPDSADGAETDPVADVLEGDAAD